MEDTEVQGRVLFPNVAVPMPEVDIPLPGGRRLQPVPLPEVGIPLPENRRLMPIPLPEVAVPLPGGRRLEPGTDGTAAAETAVTFVHQ